VTESEVLSAIIRREEAALQAMGLNHRQIQAVLYMKERGKITNKDYQGIAGASKATATRDLEDLVWKGANGGEKSGNPVFTRAGR
jgi:ATP-dependent DNA helicase RecG